MGSNTAFIKQIEIGPMMNFVYLIGCTEAREAAVVDPAWDVPTILKVAQDSNFKIRNILITHGHPDHINGLEALLEAFRQDGKKSAACFSTNPIDLGWTIPGASGHDHNNAPGMDMDCPGYPFLQAQGFADVAVEVAMYLDLSQYEAPAMVAELHMN